MGEILEYTRKSRSNSAKPIGAGAEEFEEVEVAEDLELLADFVGEGLRARIRHERSQNPQPLS